MEWQDIPTAPRFEVEFQAWCKRADGVGTGWWEPRVRVNTEGNFEIYGRVDYDEEGWEMDYGVDFVAWMPHPEAPVSDQ